MLENIRKRKGQPGSELETPEASPEPVSKEWNSRILSQWYRMVSSMQSNLVWQQDSWLRGMWDSVVEAWPLAH